MARAKTTFPAAPAKLSPAQKNQELLAEDPNVKEKARQMYMHFVDFGEICKALGVSTTTVATWRKRDQWAIQREEASRSLIEDNFAGRRVSISRITTATTEQIERGLAFLRSRPTPPTIQEVERLSVILANLDKIARLDSNQATENIAVNANVKLSAEQIRSIIAADPFLVPSG